MREALNWLAAAVRRRLQQNRVDVTEAARREAIHREAERNRLEVRHPTPETVVRPIQPAVPVPPTPISEVRRAEELRREAQRERHDTSPWQVPEQDSRYSPASDNDTALPGTVPAPGVARVDRERVPPATWATPARRQVTGERLALAGVDIAPPENDPPVPHQNGWLISAAFVGLLGVVVGGHLFRSLDNAPTFSLVHTSAGDVDAGRAAFNGYGCNACHIETANSVRRGEVGPDLTRFANRVTIAGRLANNSQNLVHFIRYPQQVMPGSAMPNLNVTETDALNIAAYLYTLGETP